jgi:hypothetical protein
VTSRPVLVAFVAFVLLAGSNAAAVKVVLGELAPFWSAGCASRGQASCC